MVQKRQSKVGRKVHDTSDAEHLEMSELSEWWTKSWVQVELIEELEQAHEGDEEREAGRIEANPAGAIRSVLTDQHDLKQRTSFYPRYEEGKEDLVVRGIVECQQTILLARELTVFDRYWQLTSRIKRRGKSFQVEVCSCGANSALGLTNGDPSCTTLKAPAGLLSGLGEETNGSCGDVAGDSANAGVSANPVLLKMAGTWPDEVLIFLDIDNRGRRCAKCPLAIRGRLTRRLPVLAALSEPGVTVRGVSSIASSSSSSAGVRSTSSLSSSSSSKTAVS